MLDDEDTWEGLIDDVASNLKTLKSKKPYLILILDMSGDDSKAMTATSKKVKPCLSFAVNLLKTL